MELEVVIQYFSYVLIAIGLMAFVVSVITQVIKTLPWFERLPTSAVVIALSLILCPASFIAMMAWTHQTIAWYMVFACFIASFIVALVAMGGWEKISEIYNRTKYPYKNY